MPLANKALALPLHAHTGALPQCIAGSDAFAEEAEPVSVGSVLSLPAAEVPDGLGQCRFLE